MARTELIQTPEFRAFLESIENDNTRSCYAADVLGFEQWLGERTYAFRDVTVEKARAYVRAMTEHGYKLGTVHRKVSALNAVYVGCGQPSPFDGMGSRSGVIRSEQVQAAYLEPDTLARLRLSASRYGSAWQIARNKAMVSVLIDTGISAVELSRLNVENVCNGWLQVSDDDHIDGYRIVPMSAQTAKEILEWLWHRGAMLGNAGPEFRALFANHRGGRLTRQGLWIVVGTLATAEFGKAEGKKVTPEAIRRTWITNAIEKNTDLDDVAAVVGIHSSSRRSNIGRYRRAS
jgi:site-specific recombinase XerD